MSDEPCVCGTPFICLADHSVTVWCVACGGSADVIEQSWQPSGPEPSSREVLVRMLDCGHDEVLR